MNRDLALMLSLRRVFRLIREGSGVAHAVVCELGLRDARGRDAARSLLLGYPLQSALGEMRGNQSDEIAILATLIVGTKASSSGLVGQAGEDLSLTLETWMKEKENTRMEDKVMSFRSLFASAVLGAVMAMVATVGPLVGSLNFSALPTRDGSGNVLIAAVGMTSVSSLMLGLFTSRRKLVLNLVVSLLAFAIVASLASPLGSIQSGTLWGIK